LLRMAPPLVAVLSTNRQLLQVKTAPALTNTAPPLIAEPPLKLVKAPLYVAPGWINTKPPLAMFAGELENCTNKVAASTPLGTLTCVLVISIGFDLVPARQCLPVPVAIAVSQVSVEEYSVKPPLKPSA
jgi:hypothetical protein